jgi:hypothetical protein
MEEGTVVGRWSARGKIGGGVDFGYGRGSLKEMRGRVWALWPG